MFSELPHPPTAAYATTFSRSSWRRWSWTSFVRRALAFLLERNAQQTEIGTIGSTLFWTTTQLLTVSSQVQNPISPGGRILDIFMEAYAIIVIATLAGALGTFLQKRGREIESERH
jgi:hypothetical protein